MHHLTALVGFPGSPALSSTHFPLSNMSGNEMCWKLLALNREGVVTEREGALYIPGASGVEIQNKRARKSVASTGLGER